MRSLSRLDQGGHVYLMCSQPRGTLYLGVTSDLPLRLSQHRHGLKPGFTKQYGVHRLAWYEHHETIVAAIAREKAMKFWKRAWKVALIEEANPHWDDLALLFGHDPLPPHPRHAGERQHPLPGELDSL
ncbi:GIY-YIG nuclease family protein [Glacieibacterium frigidum]|uniref:GIY-YIG nuclease family protein n=1 Tax=Glacieibacterium frigidum TaxID=2593303 RepID=A0A552U7N5_9SPHN|nr:GIY-YIG nuclease family protein [Glacieibacterium frigidum]TRW14232.1 GIY-YIG nuclease family protein [Glacieibacterium frigidum]